jgi:hypothetical protein
MRRGEQSYTGGDRPEQFDNGGHFHKRPEREGRTRHRGRQRQGVYYGDSFLEEENRHGGGGRAARGGHEWRDSQRDTLPSPKSRKKIDDEKDGGCSGGTINFHENHGEDIRERNLAAKGKNLEGINFYENHGKIFAQLDGETTSKKTAKNVGFLFGDVNSSKGKDVENQGEFSKAPGKEKKTCS